MILRIFTLTLEPENPIRFSIDGLRTFFSGQLAEYAAQHKDITTGFLHRYPAVQCKTIKNSLMVIGISQGADLIHRISDGHMEIGTGDNTSTILERDPAIRQEEFGISGESKTYEFLTPWLALNQQNAKKFYDLTGKPERDAFMLKILTGNLTTLAKSVDYTVTTPIICEAKVRFKRERIKNENVMVFVGRFTTHLNIPDYFGIGQSVSQGFGTIWEMVPENPEIDP
jgi:hypothetical protein